MTPSIPTRIGIAYLRARLGVNGRTVGRWVAAGKFPAPHYLGTLRRWWLHDIEAWEAAQAATPPPARPRAAEASQEGA